MKQKWNLKKLLFVALLAGLLPVLGFGQTKVVQGTVSDESGATLPGVSISIEGTATGTVTNIDGHYSIDAKSTDVLVFSFVGMQTQKKQVENQTVINVTLASAFEELEEVMVVAYGTQKKATITGAISSISNEELLKSPNSSVANTLAGAMAGVTTIQWSGQPGAEDPQIFIRGAGSLSDNASSPLIMVDGVERSFSQLDPNEIENVTVLKDASATAVFGVRGANGVILVTTKRGTEGKAKIAVSSSVSLQMPTRLLDMADSYTYAQNFNEKELNDNPNIGAEKIFSPEQIEAYKTGSNPIMYPNVDWADYLFRNAFEQTQHNLNISGGTKVVKYFVSMGFMSQDGLLKDLGDLSYDQNYSYNRYNYRTNLDIDITKTTLMKINIGGRIGKQNKPIESGDDLWKTYIWSQPMSSPGIIDGKYITTATDDMPMELKNPLAAWYGKGFVEKYTNNLNLDLSIKQNLDFITKGLSVGVKGSYNSNYTLNKTRQSSIESYTPYYRSVVLADGLNPGDEGFDDTIVYKQAGSVGELGYSESYGKGRNWYLESRINYTREFGDHNVTGLLLYNQSNTYYPGTYSHIPLGYVGLVGRGTYNYKHKYLVDFNIGYNGSENFAPGETRFGVFPALSLGWVISEEKFMEKNNWINYLKFRGSYGLVGNDKLGSSRFLYIDGVWNQVSNGYSFGIDNPVYHYAANEGKLGNGLVTWETAAKQNYGFDLRLLDSKLSISADYFSEKREDILITRKTTPVIGAVALPAVNLGKVDNGGFEINVGWSDKIESAKLKYRINANVSYAKNEIVFKDEIQQKYGYMMETGGQTGRTYGYIFDRLYQEDDFNYVMGDDGTQLYDGNGLAVIELKEGLDNPGVSVRPGDVKYKDLNDDKVIDSYDQMYSGYANRPNYVFGLNTNVDWNGLSLSMQWTGATQVTRNLETALRTPFSDTGRRGLVQFMADDHWTPETAETATLPRFSNSQLIYNYRNSDLWLKDASYIRLKKLQVAYKFKQIPVFQSIGIKSMSVYLSGYNILTFDKLKIVDPESTTQGGGNSTYPITKIYSLGVKLNF